MLIKDFGICNELALPQTIFLPFVNFYNPQYFTNYLSKENLDSYDYFIDEINYRIFDRDVVYTDMNNDDLVDILAFSTAFPPGSTYSYQTGRYFFLSDHTESNNFISDPSTINFSGARMIPTDFNNDGNIDLICRAYHFVYASVSDSKVLYTLLELRKRVQMK